MADRGTLRTRSKLVKFCFRVLVGAVTSIILILTLVYFNRREGAGSVTFTVDHAHHQLRLPRHGGAGGRAAGATSLAATPLADSEIETRSIATALPSSSPPEDAPSTSYASDDGRDKHPKVPAACASVHQEYDVHPRRFTLALGYWEQLTNGMANLFSLVRIGREWGARVVVPFATRAIVTGGGNISMDLLLDFDKINSDLLCNKHRLPEIVRFNYFLQYAVRNVTYIHMVWGGGQDESVIRCNWTTKHQEEFQSKINRLAKLANEPVFQITSTCCINPKKPVEPKVMIDNCGLLDHENSTVVFDEWRGHTNANSKDPRFFIPNVPESESPHPDSVFPVSEAVIANASAFKQSFAANKSFMAVHFRTAKLVQGTKKHISEVFQVIANLTSSNSHLSCFFFVDYGPYGIEDWEEDVARPVISQLETVRHIAPTRYDPSKFNGLNNAGFVSLVEKYAIAQAEVLVLAGGGSFQRELEEKYKKLHKSKYGQMHTIRYEAI